MPWHRGDTLSFGQFELEPANGSLRRAGAPVKLAPQPYRALTFLVERAGSLVTREELSRAIWDGRTVVDFEHGLNTCLRQIRLALGEDARDPRLIETVPRLGYRLKIPVSRESALDKQSGEVWPTSNPAAYTLYVRAWNAWDMAVGWNAWAALRLFEQAASLDPDFSEARAGVAMAYLLLSATGDVRPRVAAKRARQAVTRALLASPACVEALTASAWYKEHCEYDFDGAEPVYRRAIELGPGNVAAHDFYSMLLGIQGRFAESLDELQVAQRLDPFSWRLAGRQAGILYLAREYDEAICRAQWTLEHDPNGAWTWQYLGLSYEAKGDFAGAIAAYLKAGKLGAGHLGRAYALAGRTGEAEIMLAALEKRYQENGVAQAEIAMVHSGLGRIDCAIQWLTSAFREQAWLGTLQVAAFWDRLRPDPSFGQLLRQIGLADLGKSVCAVGVSERVGPNIPSPFGDSTEYGVAPHRDRGGSPPLK
jgi:DNA-binding winged helix-turn-helix (wHTH) protein